ncbi:pupal cuticle protein Edg-84A-like [Contarinia nasturtii]|uniref:pupal cuticle protein Edg-84A-like n=1 Tax=Contarinia nasturtii TaxID=265458 RepID=UPI0012D410F4|nr:pupal cuticle protein Edg-84A-like [Contarinia nasturtii]
MKCGILFIALVSVLSLDANAVSVDYYPHDHHSHPAHVKYIEPTHVKPVNYIQSAPIAPVYKHIQAAPVKYVHPEPHHVKYVDNHYAKKFYEPEYKHVEYDAPAQYEFGYDVNDPNTGDVKSHSEKRDGHTVHGSYTVLDPDGFKRIVEYTADEHNGFNAVVRREPVDVKVIKKVYEPELVKHVAPVAVKYYTPQHEAIVAEPPKYVAPVHQKVFSPIVKQYTVPPQYYAKPEHPKFFKPIETVAKIVKPSYEYDPHPHHTAVKYVTPGQHYNHY